MNGIDITLCDYHPVRRPGIPLVIAMDGARPTVAKDAVSTPPSLEVFTQMLAFLADKLSATELDEFKGILAEVGLGHPLSDPDPDAPESAQALAGDAFRQAHGFPRPVRLTPAEQKSYAERFPNSERLAR